MAEENKQSQQEQPQQEAEANQPAKTFTQEEVNSFLAGEKRQARVSVLKALGFDVSDDAKYADLIKQAKGVLDSQKTQSQLDSEAKAAAEKTAAEAVAKLATLQMKFDALAYGVKPEAVDDIIALIAPHVTEEKTSEQLLKEYKEKYPMFYTGTSSTTEPSPANTGSIVNPPKKTEPKTEGLGSRLGKAGSAPAKKSSYFKR